MHPVPEPVGQRWACPAGKVLGPSLVPPPGQGQGPYSRAGLAPPGGPAASPAVPRVPPCRAGPTQGGERACRDLGGSSSSLQETSTFRGTWLSPDCACACVYLPSDLSVCIYVCGNVGAKEAEGGGALLRPPVFCPRAKVSLARVELGRDAPGVSSQAGGLAQPLSRGLCT